MERHHSPRMHFGCTAVCIALYLVVAALPASAEEILLKDGTKIVGRMLSIKGDSIEVQTPYGKIKVSRENIISISFPENQPPSQAAEAPPDVPRAPVEETLEGTTYTNKTGSFTLAVPRSWKIAEDVRETNSDAIAGLKSEDGTLFLLVTREESNWPLPTYLAVLEVMWKGQVSDYEKLEQTESEINRKQAVQIVFRGTTPTPQRFPVRFLVTVVAEPGIVTRITSWCMEPLFSDARTVLDKIARSYQTVKQ